MEEKLRAAQEATIDDLQRNEQQQWEIEQSRLYNASEKVREMSIREKFYSSVCAGKKKEESAKACP